jgi:hypothetical protein
VKNPSRHFKKMQIKKVFVELKRRKQVENLRYQEIFFFVVIQDKKFIWVQNVLVRIFRDIEL